MIISLAMRSRIIGRSFIILAILLIVLAAFGPPTKQYLSYQYEVSHPYSPSVTYAPYSFYGALNHHFKYSSMLVVDASLASVVFLISGLAILYLFREKGTAEVPE